MKMSGHEMMKTVEKCYQDVHKENISLIKVQWYLQ